MLKNRGEKAESSKAMIYRVPKNPQEKNKNNDINQERKKNI